MVSPHISVSRMAELIRDHQPETWPEGWHSWSNTKQAMISESRNFASSLRKPGNVGVGRGIITASGSKHFPSLYVMLRRLRELGCTLPVEVWHLNEIDPSMQKILSNLNAECIDATALRNALPCRILRGWELKPYAALHSQFSEVLWLDADSIPRRDPASLFNSVRYAETGCVVWPDFPTWTWTVDQWQAFGLSPRNGLHTTPEKVVDWFGKVIDSNCTPPHETGQWLIDKNRRWMELRLASWWCEHSDYMFKHQHGDVGMFQIAFAQLGTDYASPRYWPSYDTHTILQYDFDGKVIFGHRTQGKFVYGENQSFSLNLQPDEQRLHEIAAELPKIWSGVPWDNTTHRSPREQAIADRLVDNCWTYRRIGLDDGRPFTFLQDGRIDHGSAGCERLWRVFEFGGKCKLHVYGEQGFTFEAEPDTYGAWRGSWSIGEKAPIEITPGGPGPWSQLVTVPTPPRLHITRTRSRAVVTVAFGDYGLRLFEISGKTMKEYADRLNVDFIVLDWPGSPDWPMSSKYGVGPVLEHYSRIIYIDADILVPNNALDLFAITPEDKVGACDELPLLKTNSNTSILAEYRWVCHQQGLDSGHMDWYANAGVICLSQSHKEILSPPKKSVPSLNLSEQHIFNSRLRVMGCFHTLPRECNWQWWSDPKFVNAPPNAILHFTGFTDSEERISVMRDHDKCSK